MATMSIHEDGTAEPVVIDQPSAVHAPDVRWVAVQTGAFAAMIELPGPADQDDRADVD